MTDTLYVNPDTLDRLLASERAVVVAGGDVRFPNSDFRYPGCRILVSREVIGNSVHRTVWNAGLGQEVFEFLGYI